MSQRWSPRLSWSLLVSLFCLTVGAISAEAGNAATYQAYLPFAIGSGSVASCEIDGQSYSQMGVNGRSLDEDVSQNPDYNLGYRGYAPTSAELTLVDLGPVVDTGAPQLAAIFSDNRTPQFSNAYQRYRWDTECDCRDDSTRSRWETTVLGMATQSNEIMRTPDSGYDIGGGNEYMVLYADSERVTLHVGNSDALDGYVVHMEGFCVDPNLVDLYEQLDGNGRGELPVLEGAQPIGRAVGGEIKVAVRDSGHFLDPRSRNSWWQGR